MSKITDIYKEYKIMPNLQLHQLRAGAVAEMICDSMSIDIDKENIIKACLLHDMGNIIKFRLDYFPEFNGPEGMEYWQGVQNEYINKYGKDEHLATVKIGEELGLSRVILDLIDGVDPSLIEKNRQSETFSEKICIYSDNRVNPHGIVSVRERNIEAKERYKDHPHAFNEDTHSHFNVNINEIEKQIFSYSNIKPEDINDESVSKYIEKLKNFEI